MPDVIDVSTSGVGGSATLENCPGRIHPPQLREKHAEGLVEEREGGREGREGMGWCVRRREWGSRGGKAKNEKCEGWGWGGLEIILIK